ATELLPPRQSDITTRLTGQLPRLDLHQLEKQPCRLHGTCTPKLSNMLGTRTKPLPSSGSIVS
ncbi:MAG: hypothetical protein LC775_11210, partial [Acidobacteria bacterium]|nr:hypothetical protein [Acidobacteriota bacterium]